jgi:serine/threonine protein kinase
MECCAESMSFEARGTSRGLSCDGQSFLNEVVTWRYLRHPNIVPFLGVCDKSPLCLVSRWMEEGTLLDFFRHHPDERRTSFVSLDVSPAFVWR